MLYNYRKKKKNSHYEYLNMKKHFLDKTYKVLFKLGFISCSIFLSFDYLSDIHYERIINRVKNIFIFYKT